MQSKVPKCTCNCQKDISSVNKKDRSDESDMPPEARRELVLEFIAEHDMPLPPLAIWGGMKRQYRVTFSYRTLQNILSDLVESDDLFRVDTSNLKDGEIKPIDEDASSRKSYYFITDSGVDRVQTENDGH